MFDPPIRLLDDWSDEHQTLHSLLWSAFLDLDNYTAGRAHQRFRPYPSATVVRELLRKVRGVATLEISNGWGDSRPMLEGSRVRLREPFEKLALWTVAPNVMADRFWSGFAAHPPECGLPHVDSREAFEALREIFCREFERRIGLEIVAFRHEHESRSPLPPLPELGIGETRLETFAARRTARARLASDVQMPFARAQEAIDPLRWGAFGYWEPQAGALPERSNLRLCLPGGRESRPDKRRSLALRFSRGVGAFASRIDYEGGEVLLPSPGSQTIEAATNAEEARRREAYSPEAVHVELRGHLAVEKIAGRPGWTRVIADRWVRFESPNHDRFRVETLCYWLLAELLSMVEVARREGA